MKPESISYLLFLFILGLISRFLIGRIPGPDRNLFGNWFATFLITLIVSLLVTLLGGLLLQWVWGLVALLPFYCMGTAALAESCAQLTRVQLAQVRTNALKSAGKMLLFALVILGATILVSYYLEN